MKIRNGFVSNSSSSSFVIMQEDKSLGKEELAKRTKAIYRKAYGCDDFDEKADKLAEEGKFVLLIERVGYGEEENAEKLARNLCEIGNIKNVSFEFEN